MSKKRRLLLIPAVLVVLLACGAAGLYYYLTPHSRGDIFYSGGVPIFYTDEGRGEPVILIHGFAIHGDLQWRRTGIVQALRPHFRVITLDLRGHGRSGRPHGEEHYGIEFVNDIVRLMDHLGIQKAHVAGYSLGGFITLKFATLHSDRLLTASVLGAGWERPEENHFLQRVEAIADVLEKGQGVDPPSGAMGEGREKPGIVHRLFVRFATRFMNDGAALAGALRSAKDLMVAEEDLHKIYVPVLCIAGTCDPLYVGAQNLQRALPEAQVVTIEGATHLSAATCRAFRDALLKFLLNHRGQNPGPGFPVRDAARATQTRCVL